MLIDLDRVIAALQELVRIPSVGSANNGPRSGVCDESRLAAHLAARFQALGAEVVQEEVLPHRPNTYALFTSPQATRWVGVDVHIDTVGVETMQGEPFDGRLADGRVYGRGAVDTKATLALVLAALEQAQADGRTLPVNLLVCATVDEETTLSGAYALAGWLRRTGLQLDSLIVAEPTLCVPIFGHKGALGLTFSIQGLATHSAKPHLGKNAISAATKLISALEAEHERLQQSQPSTPLGNGTLTVTMIQGGQGHNVVPDACRVVVDRRLVPGEAPQLTAQALDQRVQSACPLPYVLQTTLELPAFYQQPNTPLLQQLSAWSGSAPDVVPYATNAVAYSDLPATDVAVFGPGSIDQAHRDVEWVAVEELRQAAGVYAHWLGLG